ncbi:MAG TPA: DUF488 domain-containing protein [Candidatus Saccharimonadia bacterium]|nr:DUF488 domain-containing protein [Candidatus Saccharimonadia bacterium]
MGIRSRRSPTCAASPARAAIRNSVPKPSSASCSNSTSPTGASRTLGGRRTARADSRNTAWRNASFRGYADYMESAEYAAALARLGEFARRRCAVMCAEALWWRCHRALLSDDLKRRGAQVLHVGGNGALSEHPYTGAARVAGDRLSYDAAAADLFNSH